MDQVTKARMIQGNFFNKAGDPIHDGLCGNPRCKRGGDLIERGRAHINPDQVYCCDSCRAEGWRIRAMLQKRDRAIRVKASAMDVMEKHPEILDFMTKRIQKDIEDGKRVSCAVHFHACRIEMGLPLNNSHMTYVVDRIILNNPDFAEHIPRRERKRTMTIEQIMGEE